MDDRAGRQRGHDRDFEVLFFLKSSETIEHYITQVLALSTTATINNIVTILLCISWIEWKGLKMNAQAPERIA